MSDQPPSAEGFIEWEKRESVAEALRRDDVAFLRRAVVFISMYSEDYDYAVDLCLKLSSHSDPQVAGNAILGFGHIARVHRRLDQEKIQPIIDAGLSSPYFEVSGHAWSAADDTSHFLHWRYHRPNIDLP